MEKFSDAKYSPTTVGNQAYVLVRNFNDSPVVLRKDGVSSVACSESDEPKNSGGGVRSSGGGEIISGDGEWGSGFGDGDLRLLRDRQKLLTLWARLGVRVSSCSSSLLLTISAYVQTDKEQEIQENS